MPFSIFTNINEYKFVKDIAVFFKSVGWSWLLVTPLFLMNVGAPVIEKRHTIYKFAVQVAAAMTMTLICTAFAFYIGMRVFTAEMTVEIKFIKESLETIKLSQSKQIEVNSKNDIEFLTHKHSRKDGAVKLRGE